MQLQELFDVRHSVFIVGNAGTGKSMVWKSLFKANQIMKKKPMAVDLNPKAVTNNELFGIINPATREWKDGLRLTFMTLIICCQIVMICVNVVLIFVIKTFVALRRVILYSVITVCMANSKLRCVPAISTLCPSFDLCET